jgi:Methyltransferase domain
MRFGRETTFSSLRDTQGTLSEVSNPLLAYFNAHKEGAGIWKSIHYFDIYQRHFHKFVGREVHVLEVGIYSGGSLSMWREYFGESCHVYGVDIEPACMAYSDEKTKVFIGDQADRAFWAKVRKAVPTIDILIDDGGHLPEQQRITLEEMLPHICSGGVYLCEDILGANNEFAAYVQGLANGLNFATPAEMPRDTAGLAFTATGLQGTIDSIHLYPHVAVIEKRERNLDLLVAAKHGTEWRW